jgi:hypothetical protein
VKSAVIGARPVLERFKTLCAEAGAENEIADTKLFGFVVSVKDELIVSDVAVEDKEMFVPATKFEGPNGI